jgi:hypothetical protein
MKGRAIMPVMGLPWLADRAIANIRVEAHRSFDCQTAIARSAIRI